MKKIWNAILILLLVSLVWDCRKDEFVEELRTDNPELAARAAACKEPVTVYPFTEDFDTPFNPGSAYFLEHWWGNGISTGLLQQTSEMSHSPPYSLLFAPEEEEAAAVAQLSLDLSGKDYTYLDFQLATLENGGAKRTRLSVSVSINGGPFSFGTKIGPKRGYENRTTDFDEKRHPLPAVANGQPCVKVRFNAKTGGGPHEPVRLLIDDVEVNQADRDIFEPYIIGEVRPSNTRTIEIKFSEPLLPSSAENERNYNFFWPDEDPHGEPYVQEEGFLPRVSRATLTDGGHTVRLQVSPALEVGAYYGMDIKNIEDLCGNAADFEIEELAYNVPAPGDLMITEVFFADPSSARSVHKLQFVEIYNPTNKAVPLGGLRIKGAISAHNMPNVKLGPGEFWVITRNAEAFEQTFSFPAWEWKGSWIQQEPEDMEPQVLFIQGTDHHGAPLVDYVSMDFNDGRWAALNRDGYAVELGTPTGDNNQPENWMLAEPPEPFYYTASRYPIYATPGTGPMAEIACGENGEGVAVYHKSGRRWVHICIDREDLADHLAHGDWLGAPGN